MAVGILVVIEIIAIILFSVIGLFVGNIIIFDSIALAILADLLASKLLHIHPALSLLIGIGTFILLYIIQSTKLGFWIIGGILSLFWAFVFGLIAHLITNGDKIWSYVVFGLGFIIMILLHLSARGSSEGSYGNYDSVLVLNVKEEGSNEQRQ